MPPFSAPGVIDVMLSTNRCVATSISLADMSRPTETRWLPSTENAVSSTQSSWALLKQNLLAGLGVDRADRFVGAAEGDAFAVGRPGGAEERDRS